MENSLQQLNKQKKSASDNSADEAKRFNLRLKDSKHYLINYLETAERQGETETQIGVYEGLLERYKVPTWELRRQARLHDNEEVRTQLAMRQIIERKQQLNRQLTQFREAREMAQASQRLKLAYNDPETLRQLDREIAATGTGVGNKNS